MLALKGFVPPGTDSADPPVGCGEIPELRAKGLVPLPAVVADRPTMLFCVGDAAVRIVGGVCVVRAKGLVDFDCCCCCCC